MFSGSLIVTSLIMYLLIFITEECDAHVDGAKVNFQWISEDLYEIAEEFVRDMNRHNFLAILSYSLNKTRRENYTQASGARDPMQACIYDQTSNQLTYLGGYHKIVRAAKSW